MKTTIRILLLFISVLIAAACAHKSDFTLNMAIVPSDKNLSGLSEKLALAGGIIEKRLLNAGIESDNIKTDITSERINLTINELDTSYTLIIENLVTVRGNTGFWETYENKEVLPFISEANKKLSELKIMTYDEKQSESVPADTAASLSIEDMLKTTESHNDTAMIRFKRENPLFGILFPRVNYEGEPIPSCMIGLSGTGDTSRVNQLLKMKEISEIFPGDIKFMWSKYPYKYDESKSMYELHALKVTTRDGMPLLDGNSITNTKVINRKSEVFIDFSMNADGAKVWARMTRENKDKCIAVVIDDRVRSYPRVMNEITGGNTEISGDFTMAEARYLSFILNSGANGLPLDLKIDKEQIDRKE